MRAYFHQKMNLNYGNNIGRRKLIPCRSCAPVVNGSHMFLFKQGSHKPQCLGILLVVAVGKVAIPNFLQSQEGTIFKSFQEAFCSSCKKQTL